MVLSVIVFILLYIIISRNYATFLILNKNCLKCLEDVVLKVAEALFKYPLRYSASHFPFGVAATSSINHLEGSLYEYTARYPAQDLVGRCFAGTCLGT